MISIIVTLMSSSVLNLITSCDDYLYNNFAIHFMRSCASVRLRVKLPYSSHCKLVNNSIKYSAFNKIARVYTHIKQILPFIHKIKS